MPAGGAGAGTEARPYDNGILLPWMTSFTPPARGSAEVKNGAMCLTVEQPGKDRWDAQLRHREMILQQGHSYRLSFKVWASRATRITVKVGKSGPPYTDYWTRMIPLTKNPQVISTEFRMAHPDDATVELALHAGGAMVTGIEPVELCFDDVVLSDPEYIPQPPAPVAIVPKIRVNQLGYLPHAAKLATWVSLDTAPHRWELLDSAGQVVARGETIVHGPDISSGDSVHVIDFSGFERSAQSLVLQVGGDKSDAFAVGARIYRSLARDALRFFYHNRSGIAVEMPQAGRPEWARPAGHTARCLTAAQTAWVAATAHPDLFAPATDSMGGGAYEDSEVQDEFYWAAAELYLTTGRPEYQRSLTESRLDGAIAPDLVVNGRATSSAATWQRVDVLCKISLALAPNPVAKGRANFYRKQLRDTADQLLATRAHQGYRFPMESGADGAYPWGSNSLVLGNMVLLGAAADFTGADKYLARVVSGMDYLLGRNALGQSYVTGYGTRPLRNPRHRFWAHQANPKYPTAPPGIVSGGPNSRIQDPYSVAAGLKGCPLQKCFVDHIEAYSVNELAINWNAALLWAAAWLDEHGAASAQ